MTPLEELESAAMRAVIYMAKERQGTSAYQIMKDVFDRGVVRKALQMNGGNQTKAALFLNVNRGTFRKKQCQLIGITERPHTDDQ